MLIAKSRLQGSSVVITLPSDNGKKPKENKEYIVVYSDDGTITLAVSYTHLTLPTKLAV